MNHSSYSIIMALFIFLFAAVATKPLSRLTRIPYPILLMTAGVLLNLAQEPLSLPLKALTTKEVAHDIILLVLLPTLVFETAYNLDISKLAANRLAIFVLALPGVLISTLVVATFVGGFTSLGWHFALLLGAILSATDPTAVISAFRQLGAPKDLIMLIEGESLFNDATAITLTKILFVSFTLAGGAWSTLWYSCSLFLLTLGGGIICGWLFARLLLLVLDKLPDDPFLEISLSLLLAFGSYLFAEEVLHASGIVATTIAGITLATNAPLPISRNSQQYLNHFWSYLSFIASAIIFMIVGLWMDFALIWDNAGISLVVLAALWLSRALIAYGLLPQIGHLQRLAKPTPMGFRHLVYVGGMRGAVTMALAMGLVTMTGDETILSIAINVVFITIILQGLLIGPLASHLSLKERDINDSIATTELTLSALHYSRKALQPLLKSTFAQTGAPQELTFKLRPIIEEQEKQLRHWFSVEVGPIGLWNRLMLRCASIEIGYLYQLFDGGLIKASVFEQLKNSLDEQMEAIRHQYQRPTFSHLPKQVSSLLHRARQQVASPHPVLVEHEYEMAWARLISCTNVLEGLETITKEEGIPPTVADNVAKIWLGWLESCEVKIAEIEKQQPVMAARVQRQLLRNYLKTAQSEHLQQYVQQCLISEEDAERIKKLLKSMDI
ncbi:sodium:proton antiporter [Photobacterium sp. SDRW27]|uniref:cation:proton antiporter n=1 Tax=Photobacterium obscurum TaxID=2829490 RepID=UPI00224480C6|nr:sodium:proton antiporter [Photobacterium obscurum]MCW8330167.1 sodium:proton antiporter [Photobacterium obscurum]